MKKIVNTLFILLIVSSTVFVSSCGKKGCTDTDASNYSANAKRDDGECRFEGSVVFWVSETSAQQMLSDTIQSLTVYFDGDIVGTIKNAGQDLLVAPICDEENAVTVKLNLFAAKTKAISYRVLDNKGIKRWAGVVTMNGNKCEPHQLVYFP